MKICHISDTHKQHHNIKYSKIKADFIIHSGDFTSSRNLEINEKETYDFLEWFGSLKNFKYKILIAGNHDIYVDNIGKDNFKHVCHLYDIIYLEDELIVIDGIKIYGSPWSPTYGNFPFQDEDLFLIDYWTYIPDDVNILITHTPPFEILDEVEYYHGPKDGHVGSCTLLKRVKALKELKAHCFGHIHDSPGVKNINGVIYSNAVILNFNSMELNTPNLINI